MTNGDVGTDGIRIILLAGSTFVVGTADESVRGTKMTEAKLSSDSMLVSLCRLLSFDESVNRIALTHLNITIGFGILLL